MRGLTCVPVKINQAQDDRQRLLLLL